MEITSWADAELHIDGKRDTWPVAQRSKFSASEFDPTQIAAVSYCWRTDLSEGIHLAEVILYPHGAEVLRYDWAFKVAGH